MVEGFNWMKPGRIRKAIKLICLILAILAIVLYMPKHNICISKYKSVTYHPGSNIIWYVNYTHPGCRPNAGDTGIAFILGGAFMLLFTEPLMYQRRVFLGGRPIKTSGLSMFWVMASYSLGLFFFVMGVYRLISSGFFFIR